MAPAAPPADCCLAAYSPPRLSARNSESTRRCRKPGARPLTVGSAARTRPGGTGSRREAPRFAWTRAGRAGRERQAERGNTGKRPQRQVPAPRARGRTGGTTPGSRAGGVPVRDVSRQGSAPGTGGLARQDAGAPRPSELPSRAARARTGSSRLQRTKQVGADCGRGRPVAAASTHGAGAPVPPGTPVKLAGLAGGPPAGRSQDARAVRVIVGILHVMLPWCAAGGIRLRT